MAGYGPRAELFQADMRQGVSRLLDEAAAAAGLRRDGWTRQTRGDGEFAVLPEDEPEDRVVYQFVQELNAGLGHYNRLKADEAGLRLRLALHFGPASPGASGFTGSGPVVAEQLCGSGLVRKALELGNTPLVVVLSEVVYTDTVRSLRIPVPLKRLRRVRIREEDWEGDAWLWLPGHDANDLPLTDRHDGPAEAARTASPPRPDEEPRPEPRGTRVENFRGATVIGQAIVGDSNTFYYRDL